MREIPLKFLYDSIGSFPITTQRLYMALSQQLRKQHRRFDLITDLLCLLSVIGIWPRYIESQNVRLIKKTVSLGLQRTTRPMRLLHLTDLHLNQRLSKSYLKQIEKLIADSQADLIVFTGDFLCFGDCDDWDRLQHTLSRWKAPLGVFCVPGNHDYCKYITIEKGTPICCQEPRPFLYRAIKKLLHTPPEEIPTICEHPPLQINERLREILTSLNIEILDNATKSIDFQGSCFDLLGVEDLWARGGAFIQEKAQRLLQNSSSHKPKILLAHNPQSWKLLPVPTSNLLMLSGHTHGGNVSLPWLNQRLRNTSVDIPQSGWLEEKSSSLLVSRGLGSPYPFRLFASPELHLLEIT